MLNTVDKTVLMLYYIQASNKDSERYRGMEQLGSSSGS